MLYGYVIKSHLVSSNDYVYRISLMKFSRRNSCIVYVWRERERSLCGSVLRERDAEQFYRLHDKLTSGYTRMSSTLLND